MYVVKIRPMQTRGRGCISILFDGCLIDTKRNPVYFDILVKRSTICELATLEIYTSEANVRCPYTFSIIVAEDLAKELDAASDVSVSDRSPSAAIFKCDVRRSAKVDSQSLRESLEFSFRRLFFLGAHPNICDQQYCYCFCVMQGAFECSTTFLEAGCHLLAVFICGHEMNGSPFEVAVQLRCSVPQVPARNLFIDSGESILNLSPCLDLVWHRANWSDVVRPWWLARTSYCA